MKMRGGMSEVGMHMAYLLWLARGFTLGLIYDADRIRPIIERIRYRQNPALLICSKASIVYVISMMNRYD